jgi:hypothetical protein
MTRSVRSVAPSVALAFAALALVFASARDARAQGGIEAARLTQHATENAPPPDAGPDWTRTTTPRPASRFRTLANMPPEAHGIMGQLKTGTYPGWSGRGAITGRGGGARGRQQVVEEVVLPPRKKSGAPGVVAGLVFQRANKLPVAGVVMQLISNETTFARERIEARTDSAGYYEFPAVEPGRWSLSVVGDRLNPAWAPLRAARVVTVGRREKVAADPFVLSPASCAEGHAGWSDGYVLFDAPVTIAPYDTTLLSVSGVAKGVGDYRVCGAATDSVMVWMHLRDGRSLGRTARLEPGAPMKIDFVPDPLEKMEGNILRILPVTNAGTPVPRARITVVGRRFEQGSRPALVFVREESSDRDGVLEIRVPWGVYEILAVNARDGQSGSVQQLVVDHDDKTAQPLRIELHGPATPQELAAMRERLLDRAETMLYVWTQ